MQMVAMKRSGFMVAVVLASLSAHTGVQVQDPELARQGPQRIKNVGIQDFLRQQDPPAGTTKTFMVADAGGAHRLSYDLFTGTELPRAIVDKLGLRESLVAIGVSPDDPLRMGILPNDTTFRIGDEFVVATYDRIPLLVAQKVLADSEKDLRSLANELSELLDSMRRSSAPPWNDHPCDVALQETSNPNFERIVIWSTTSTSATFHMELTVTCVSATKPRYQVAIRCMQFDKDGRETGAGPALAFMTSIKDFIRDKYSVSKPHGM